MQNVKLTLALPNVDPQTGECLTATVIVPHSSLVLAVTDNGRIQEYVPVDRVQHVITYKFADSSGLLVHIAKVLTIQTTDEPPSAAIDPNVQLNTIPNHCICISTTDVTSVALVSVEV